MPNENPYASLVRKSCVALLVVAAVVACCYVWLDRPIAEFCYRQNFARFTWLKWMTFPPPIVQLWSPLVIAALVIRWAWGAWTRFEFALLLSLVSLIVADQFRESLQALFGRDWPETWIDNNPSLIGTGAYGFHFFAGDEELGSFPSGHAARTLAFFSVWWLAFPRGRWVYGTLSLAICLALVGMNYHFLGDVIAGAGLGFLVGTWIYYLAAGKTEGGTSEAGR